MRHNYQNTVPKTPLLLLESTPVNDENPSEESLTEEQVQIIRLRRLLANAKRFSFVPNKNIVIPTMIFGDHVKVYHAMHTGYTSRLLKRANKVKMFQYFEHQNEESGIRVRRVKKDNTPHWVHECLREIYMTKFTDLKSVAIFESFEDMNNADHCCLGPIESVQIFHQSFSDLISKYESKLYTCEQSGTDMQYMRRKLRTLEVIDNSYRDAFDKDECGTFDMDLTNVVVVLYNFDSESG